jgi:hypothetical protein
MEFFNKKEEVIDLQLTQYGKYLLSLGKLKPYYYAFYDDGIVYDSEYAGFNENQNNAEPRIQENTPNLKSLYNFHSIEDEMQRAIEAKNSGDLQLARNMIQATEDRSQILINPLGKSDLGSDKVPAWNLTLLSGKMLTGSTTSTLTLSSSAAVLNIPQLELEINYKVTVKEGIVNPSQELFEAVARGEADGIPQALLERQLSGSGGFDDVNYDLRIFEDGSYFHVKNNDLIIQIIEENVPFTNDNFEVEVYDMEEVTKGGETTEDRTSLRFLVEPELVVGDILYDEDELNRHPVPQIDSSFVNYYFDFEADDEIEASLICSRIKNGDKDLNRFATRDFECPDAKPNYQFLDPYVSKAQEDECEKE